MPWNDWQFWVVTVLAILAIGQLFRPFLVEKKPACPGCSSGKGHCSAAPVVSRIGSFAVAEVAARDDAADL